MPECRTRLSPQTRPSSNSRLGYVGRVPLQLQRHINVFPSVSAQSPQVVTDAAASIDFAAIFGHHWFARPWPPEICLIPGFPRSSSLFELYPIVAAAQVWGHTWTDQIELFTTDNQVTADIINKGRSKSLPVMSFLRSLLQLSLHHQI